MILIASTTGAVIFGAIGSYFQDGSIESELATFAWALCGVIVGIVAFSLLGLI
jgi:hypothetical protein